VNGSIDCVLFPEPLYLVLFSGFLALFLALANLIWKNKEASEKLQKARTRLQQAKVKADEIPPTNTEAIITTTTHEWIDRWVLFPEPVHLVFFSWLSSSVSGSCRLDLKHRSDHRYYDTRMDRSMGLGSQNLYIWCFFLAF
jgi:hypothetical protein